MLKFVLSRHEPLCEALQTRRVTFRYCFPCSQTLHHSLTPNNNCSRSAQGWGAKMKLNAGLRPTQSGFVKINESCKVFSGFLLNCRHCSEERYVIFISTQNNLEKVKPGWTSHHFGSYYICSVNIQYIKCEDCCFATTWPTDWNTAPVSDGLSLLMRSDSNNMSPLAHCSIM